MTTILIIHTFGMGDMIMALPMIEMISKEIPQAEIDILITDRSAVFPVKNNPFINEIYTSDYGFGNLIKTIFRLRRRKYNISFVTSISFKSNTIKLSFFSYLIHAKRRYGELRKLIYPFYTKFMRFSQNIHRVQSNLDILALEIESKHDFLSMHPRIYLSKNAVDFAESFFEQKLLKKKNIIAIHPGSNPKGKHRRWDKQYFVELIKLIQDNNPIYEFVIIAGPGEQEEGKYISDETDTVLLNKNTLDQVAAIISKCNILINTDSGIGHIASAFDIKILTIFGPGDFRKTAPHSPNMRIISSNVSCSPCLYPLKNCGFKCLTNLTPQNVFEMLKAEL